MADSAWENSVITAVLHASLHPVAPPQFGGLVPDMRTDYLEQLAVMIQRETGVEKPLFSLGYVELALAEKIGLQAAHNVPAIRYLIGCFMRLDAEQQRCTNPGRAQILGRLASLLAGFIALAITDHKAFPAPKNAKEDDPPAGQEFLFWLGKETFPKGFISALLEARPDSASLNPVVWKTMDAASLALREMTLLDANCLDAMRALVLLTSVPQTARALVSHYRWIELHILGSAQQRHSVLGPFFRLSSLPDDTRVAQELFSNPSNRDELEIQRSIERVRDILTRIHRYLFTAVMNLLRSKETREPAITWLAVMLESNVSRAKLRPDGSLISTDGEFLNLTAVLLQLCAPFIDPKSDKLRGIDPTYCAGGGRLDWDQETRLSMSEPQLIQYRARILEQSQTEGTPPPDYWPPWDRHYHIICDGCRTHKPSGTRYKCANCLDYDLCEKCYLADSDALYASKRPGMATYQCPFCGEEDLTEPQLCEHVFAQHDDDRTPIVCPVCSSMPGGNPHYYSRNFIGHLHAKHEHSMLRQHKRNHVMYKLRIPVPNPTISWKTFPVLAAADTAEPVHTGIRCDGCKQEPIVGERYRCCHCPTNLCGACEAKNTHDRLHVMLHIRKPLTEEANKTDLSLPVVFPQVLAPKRGFNFITDCFYFTARALHLGMLRTSQRYLHLVRDIPPVDCPQREQLLAVKYTCDAHLLMRKVLDDTLQFYNAVAIWMNQLMGVSAASKPPSTPCPPEVSSLPEHLMMDIVEFLSFLARISPETLMQGRLEDIWMMLTTMLAAPKYMSNPHLHGHVVEMMCAIAPIRDEDLPSEGVPQLAYLFEQQPYVLANLVPALTNLYIGIEHTGADTQFYDKFTVRHAIALLFKYLWRNSVHREAMRQESRNTQHFLLFINMLVNDANYLLDESFRKLHDVYEYEQLRSDAAAFGALEPQQQREREMQHRERESYVRSLCLIGNETISMLHYLTSDETIRKPFLLPEFVDRVAAMLNYFIVELAGPNMGNLKVGHPERYRFAPKRLLVWIVQIYLHLSEYKNFREAVARDGRSFKPDIMRTAVEILRTQRLSDLDTPPRFEQFIKEVEDIAAEATAMDEAFGEIPEDFLDPITCLMMEDPVQLPSSGHVMDRSTIARHLLSDERDPFSRAPLKIEQVMPLPELKARIEAFKRTHRVDPKLITPQTPLQPIPPPSQ